MSTRSITPTTTLTITLRLTPQQHAYLADEANDLDVACHMLAAWIAEDALAEAARDAGYVAQARLRPRVRRRSTQAAQQAGNPTLTLLVRKDAHDGPCEQ